MTMLMMIEIESKGDEVMRERRRYDVRRGRGEIIHSEPNEQFWRGGFGYVDRSFWFVWIVLEMDCDGCYRHGCYCWIPHHPMPPPRQTH